MGSFSVQYVISLLQNSLLYFSILFHIPLDYSDYYKEVKAEAIWYLIPDASNMNQTFIICSLLI